VHHIKQDVVGAKLNFSFLLEVAATPTRKNCYCKKKKTNGSSSAASAWTELELNFLAKQTDPGAKFG
jgi:hypothetical protein